MLDYCNLLFPNDYKKMTKKIYKYFTDKHVKSWVYIKKKNETRSYLWDERKHNDLMSEQYKKTYLYYVEHLLILASTVTS